MRARRQQRGQMKLMLATVLAIAAGTIYSLTYLGKGDDSAEPVKMTPSVARAEQRLVQMKVERERQTFLEAKRAELSPPKPPEPEPEPGPEPLPITRAKKKCKAVSWEKAANNPKLRKGKGPLIIGQNPCEEDTSKVSFIR